MTKLYIQLSAALGPAECELAVQYTFEQLTKDAKSNQIQLTTVESSPTASGYLSMLLLAEGEQVQRWANTWYGSIQWTFQSPFRTKHPRKNWFIGITGFAPPSELPTDQSIVYQACRASGSGGQHVNTTDSAVHATHVASGISVKVMTERSQHANKRRARELIALKLLQLAENNQADQKTARHLEHAQVERGNPVRKFKH
ncbi:peptide chain release factor [Acinetobacter calcoaceticus]|uniref:Peptide chain release factor n=1 Tax=Acinetobacter calcoaceticus TaxID=471 RepID=A0A4R1XVR5_ACICA|nr:peptide chain release factor [Acinetobacter calcoaceticus]